LDEPVLADQPDFAAEMDTAARCSALRTRSQEAHPPNLRFLLERFAAMHLADRREVLHYLLTSAK
jgi:hypothetical protein